MRFYIAICLFFSMSAFASIEQAPENFKTSGGKAVFVDFLEAKYKLFYDVKKKTAWAETTIKFYQPEKGFPIFDTVYRPTLVTVNSNIVEEKLVYVPGNVSKVRIAKSELKPGLHALHIVSPIKKGVKFGLFKKRVSSGFFIKDLKDRIFLERYVPSNFEYDQYKMTFEVKILNSKYSHNVFANGTVEEISKNHIKVTYPEAFTSSSLYFHLVPKSKFKRLKFKFKSIDGRLIPVTIYSNYWLRNYHFKRRTVKVLRELERDYGAYPHPEVLIYGTKIKGGMEYAGATATSFVALGHELQHFYFAKGIMPANGNSGWMDEAIASWRDKGHQIHRVPNYLGFNLGAHNRYQRKTDKNSYEKGRSFIAYLDFKLRAQGQRMKDFLKGYFAKRKFTTVTTQDFINDLTEYSGLDLTEDFQKYIFGGDKNKSNHSPSVKKVDPFHHDYTDEELESIL